MVTSGLGTSGTLSETAPSTPGFGAPAQVNAALLHGNASLSAELEVLRDLALRDGEGFKSGAIYDEEAGEGARVGVAEWFTHRKRGLLVPFGIGLRYVIW